eukprot:m.770611 g.770611  ORF g.770611 m.770611 type:complete len:209 (-) comp23241_c0_seq3:39-665(-)
MAKLRQGQDILKASVQEEAKAKGSTMEAVLQEKLEHLSRLRQADDLHGHSGHGHEHGEGCNHSHGEHGHSHDGPVPASPYTEGMRLRFKVGDAVEARVSMVPAQWAPGTIKAIGYREPNFPPGIRVPYQVQLASGQLIFAPHDTSEVIRPSSGGTAPDLTMQGPVVPGGGHGHSHGGMGTAAHPLWVWVWPDGGVVAGHVCPAPWQTV